MSNTILGRIEHVKIIVIKFMALSIGKLFSSPGLQINT
jgi:hypothetical protein